MSFGNQDQLIWDITYHSKHHPIPHHIKVRHTNLQEPHSSQTTLQGCVNPPKRLYYRYKHRPQQRPKHKSPATG